LRQHQRVQEADKAKTAQLWGRWRLGVHHGDRRAAESMDRRCYSCWRSLSGR
jgi:hypothetical protein